MGNEKDSLLCRLLSFCFDFSGGKFQHFFNIFLVTVSKSKKISTHFQIKRKKERKTGRKTDRKGGGGRGAKKKISPSIQNRKEVNPKLQRKTGNTAEIKPSKTQRRIRTHFGHIPDASRTLPGRISDAFRTRPGRK